MTDAPADLAAGALVSGRYRLEEELGRGGAGRVFRAHDERLDRWVALKVLTDLGDAASERFRREAATAARIRHPNVVTLHDAGVDQVPYLVMSLVAGRSLEEHVRDEGPLATEDLFALAADLFAGLEATHRAGVLHRDLTPRNVLFDHDGTALLADFGIARGHDDPALTAEHTIVGTRPYVAPERMRGEHATVASDLYAAGITLRYAATGSHAAPMPADHPLAGLVARCTAPEPAARPTSAGQATTLLDAVRGPVSPAPGVTAPLSQSDGITMRTAEPLAGSEPSTRHARPGLRPPALAVGTLAVVAAAALVASIASGGDGTDAGSSGAVASTPGQADASAPPVPTFDPVAPAESSRRLAEWLRDQDPTDG